MLHIDESIISNALKHYIHLHQNPELSFQEEQTCKYIGSVLAQHEIPYKIAGKTGVIGWLANQTATYTIALRADTDALPISEDPEHPICSKHSGIMHACGHDLHTACLLGAAEYLKQHQNELPSNLLFIFQHAEEVLPGGAQCILQDEFFKSHWPEWIIAQHAEPDLPVGTTGICPGKSMASGDEIFIRLKGPGGHAALPEKTTDLVLIAAYIIVALQQITSRNASPFIPTVLSFGNIRCQSAMNIIPKEITLEGTFRTLDEEWRAKAKKQIRQIAFSTAESMGAKVEIDIIEGYPTLYNDPVKANIAMETLQLVAANNQVILLPQKMTTEDFARYSQTIPATFIRLGVNGQIPCGKLHTPAFCADPKAIQQGIRNLCALAITGLPKVVHS